MPTRTTVSRVLAAAALIIGIGAAVVPGANPVGAAGSSAPKCGGVTLLKPSGAAWVCTFDDEFNGTAINRDKWTVQKTSAGGFHGPSSCVMDNARNVAVANGALELTARRAANPFQCTMPRGSFTATWTAGSVYTKGFGQAYGRFSIRAKFPQAHGVAGLQSAIWTYPRAMTMQKAITGTTEIDIAEAYSRWPDLVNPTVHNFIGGSTTHCLVKNYGAAFHTYTVVWTPQRATFYFDRKECFWAGRVGTSQPFLVALTQGLGMRTNAFSAATPSPATMKVDWVRVWK